MRDALLLPVTGTLVKDENQSTNTARNLSHRPRLKLVQPETAITRHAGQKGMSTFYCVSMSSDVFIVRAFQAVCSSSMQQLSSLFLVCIMLHTSCSFEQQGGKIKLNGHMYMAQGKAVLAGGSG